MTNTTHADCQQGQPCRTWAARIHDEDPTSTAAPIPAHLTDEACYVCAASGPHQEGSHRYWSNAEARAYFRVEDIKHSTPGLIESRYVSQHRPY